MALRVVTAEEVKTLLSYDFATGVFTWRVNIGKARVGASAGYTCARGYCRIRIHGKPYAAHRLAWLYAYGDWPKLHIDHINGQRSDNRLCNLRDVPHHINQQNVHKPTRKSPRLGVTTRGKAFRARIQRFGRIYRLGTFETSEAAADAYALASESLQRYAGAEDIQHISTQRNQGAPA